MSTIKDIAKETGLNVGTVSRVINNRGYISEETREKVKNAMNLLNYHPNEVARSLGKRRTNTIGLIVPHIMHPYFAKLIDSMEKVCNTSGYKLIVCNSCSDKDKERSYMELCNRNRVDGIVLCSVDVDSQQFLNCDIPLVVFERKGAKGSLSVVCDNKYGGELAAMRLIKCGCKNLLHIGSIQAVGMPADDRTLGFEKICSQEHIKFKTATTSWQNYQKMDHYGILKMEIANTPYLDGIFASSDIIAAQAIQVCRRFGLTVPGMVKVIGFDDVLPSDITVPTITTIHQPIEQMAVAAISLIEAKIDGLDKKSSIKLPVRLVERDSTF